MKKILSLVLAGSMLLTANTAVLAAGLGTSTPPAIQTATQYVSVESLLQQTKEAMNQLDSLKMDVQYTIDNQSKSVDVNRIIESDKKNKAFHSRLTWNNEMKSESYVSEGTAYWYSVRGDEWLKAQLNGNLEGLVFSESKIIDFVRSATVLVYDYKQTDNTHYVIKGTSYLNQAILTLIKAAGYDIPYTVDTNTTFTLYIQKGTFYLDKIEMNVSGKNEEGKVINLTGSVVLDGFNATSVELPETLANARPVYLQILLQAARDQVKEII